MSPQQGRFLSRDTWPVNYQSPRELNRYAYTANNPVNGSDPSGNLMLEDRPVTEILTDTPKKSLSLGLTPTVLILLGLLTISVGSIGIMILVGLLGGPSPTPVPAPGGGAGGSGGPPSGGSGCGRSWKEAFRVVLEALGIPPAKVLAVSLKYSVIDEGMGHGAQLDANGNIVYGRIYEMLLDSGNIARIEEHPKGHTIGNEPPHLHGYLNGEKQTEGGVVCRAKMALRHF